MVGVAKRTKKIFGVGINDADYVVNTVLTDGRRKQCPYYNRWVCMLKRCYSEKYLEKCPTYVGCSVCEEWKTFSNFRAWLVDQGDLEGNEVDKDLFGDGKLYSPQNCRLIPYWLNAFIRDMFGQTENGGMRLTFPVYDQALIEKIKRVYIEHRSNELSEDVKSKILETLV